MATKYLASCQDFIARGLASVRPVLTRCRTELSMARRLNRQEYGHFLVSLIAGQPVIVKLCQLKQKLLGG